jgi:hypothetical protein
MNVPNEFTFDEKHFEDFGNSEIILYHDAMMAQKEHSGKMNVRVEHEAFISIMKNIRQEENTND